MGPLQPVLRESTAVTQACRELAVGSVAGLRAAESGRLPTACHGSQRRRRIPCKGGVASAGSVKDLLVPENYKKHANWPDLRCVRVMLG